MFLPRSCKLTGLLIAARSNFLRLSFVIHNQPWSSREIGWGIMLWLTSLQCWRATFRQV